MIKGFNKKNNISVSFSHNFIIKCVIFKASKKRIRNHSWNKPRRKKGVFGEILIQLALLRLILIQDILRKQPTFQWSPMSAVNVKIVASVPRNQEPPFSTIQTFPRRRRRFIKRNAALPQFVSLHLSLFSLMALLGVPPLIDFSFFFFFLSCSIRKPHRAFTITVTLHSHNAAVFLSDQLIAVNCIHLLALVWISP